MRVLFSTYVISINLTICRKSFVVVQSWLGRRHWPKTSFIIVIYFFVVVRNCDIYRRSNNSLHRLFPTKLRATQRRGNGMHCCCEM